MGTVRPCPLPAKSGRSATKVVDLKAVMAALPAAVARYREMVADLGKAPIDIERGR